MFNEDGVELVNRRCSRDQRRRPAAFNPFTATPVEGVHWRKGPNFGKATTGNDLQVPRTYRSRSACASKEARASRIRRAPGGFGRRGFSFERMPTR